jgi:hypothetical protein
MLQFIQAANGKPAGVFIPINDWKKMKKENKNLEVWEQPDLTTEQILNNIRQAVEEMKLIKAGKLEGRPAREVLDEL